MFGPEIEAGESVDPARAVVRLECADPGTQATEPGSNDGPERPRLGPEMAIERALRYASFLGKPFYASTVSLRAKSAADRIENACSRCFLVAGGVPHNASDKITIAILILPARARGV